MDITVRVRLAFVLRITVRFMVRAFVNGRTDGVLENRGGVRESYTGTIHVESLVCSV